MKIQALHLYHFMEYARVRGISEPAMLSRLAAGPADFLAAAATVEAADFYAVVKFVREALADELLGIRAGAFLNLKSLGLVYQISLQTTTVAEALFYLQHYLNASFPLIHLQTDISTSVATIVLRISNEAAAENRIILESVLTVIARELQTMAGPEFTLGLSSPFYNASYPENWQPGKSFTLAFTKAVLGARIQDKSRWQLDVLVPEYLQLIERLKAEPTFSTRVKITMLSMAQPALPDLARVADAFNLTVRTLQRRLDTENTSFRQLQGALKKEISYLLINHQRFSVAEISEVLGFAEPAAFIHSFKKWYGHSPEKFRQQLVR